MFHHYLKIAIRQIGKNKVQYFLSIIGIALGLLCFSMTNYYTHNYFSRYTAWPNADRMATVSIDKIHTTGFIQGKDLQALLNNPVAGIDKISVITSIDGANLTYILDDKNEIAYKENLYRVNDNFVDVYSIELKNGKLPVKNTNQVMISESVAKRVFKQDDPIGKTFYYNRAETDRSEITYYTITGVFYEAAYLVWGDRVDILMPAGENYINPDKFYYNNVTLLLSKGASAKYISEELKVLNSFNTEEEPRTFEVKTLPMQMQEGGNLIVLILVPILGSLVLLAALINMLKFCIQSFYSRTHELSLRKSVGSSQGGLFCMLFAEICLLILLSGLTTYCFAELFLPLFFSYLPPDMHLTGSIDAAVLYRQLLYSIIGLLFLCAFIAWVAVNRIRHISLIEGIRSNHGKHRFRNFMLGFQIFICFLFISGGIGMTMFFYLLENERYYPISNKECKEIWYIELRDPQFRGQEEQVVARIRSIPEVEEVVYFTSSYTADLRISEAKKLVSMHYQAGGNLDRLFQFSIQGRMPENENEAIVSRLLMEEIEKDSLSNGTSISIGNTMYQITGTFDVWPFTPTTIQPGSVQYSMLSGLTSEKHTFYVKSAPGQAKKAKKAILSVVREWLPPTIPFEMNTQYEINFRSYGGAKMLSDLFLLLAGIALLITILGVYSAIALDTRGRQKEVAIRKINGATAKEIRRLFGRLYIRLMAISAVFALPLVYLFLQAMIDRTIPALHNPLFWIAIVLFVAAIVFVTVGWHIRQITRVNPAEIIKTE
ncbi:putative ABC transport system permease protein [Parabacteroides sp. PFB2-10]|uniref:ABC transporter permease n=1 Tax=Parabacteroides sp. PFB2-10 TaxID=1742405 RepID=UPI0024746C07|nr:ABC transporter permease [Parabacteroides sp. PFB2-10]MDH6311697.1 putative ABC transport system permease protein [Parabacteroides sp. PFB2-10]